MPYEINKRDDVASSILVADGAINSSALSITLIGRGWDGYGEQLQENIVHIMENFSNSTPPLNPTYGQLWFDKTSNTLHIYQTDDSWRNMDDYFDESIYDIAIAPDADIQLSKLIHGSTAQILVADVLGTLQYRTLGGDATIDHNGVISLSPDSVSTSELADGLYLNAGLIDASNLNVGSSLNVGADATFASGTVSATTNSLAIQGTSAALITLDDLSGANGAEIGLGLTGDDLYFYRPKDLGGTQVPASLGAGRQLMRLEYINGLWLNNAAQITGNLTVGGSISASTTANIGTDLTVGGDFELLGDVITEFSIDVGAEDLKLKPGIADHAFMGFYARTAASSIRTGYMGFNGAGTDVLSIRNEMNNANLEIGTTGTGVIRFLSDAEFVISASSLSPSLTWKSTDDLFSVFAEYYGPAQDHRLVIRAEDDTADYITIQHSTAASGIVTVADFKRDVINLSTDVHMPLGEGLMFTEYANYFGTDARVIRLLDTNGITGDVSGLLLIEGYTTGDSTNKPIFEFRTNSLTSHQPLNMGNNDISKVNTLGVNEVAAPATPIAGTGVVYAKSDGLLYFKNDAGTEYDLTVGGGLVNADTLDSLDSTDFLRSTAANAYDVRLTSGNGRGVRYWDSDDYKTYMSSTADATWGGSVVGSATSDYNMYFKMNGGTNRGFVFKNGTTAVAQIDGGGNVHAKSKVHDDGGQIAGWRLHQSFTGSSPSTAYLDLTFTNAIDLTSVKEVLIKYRLTVNVATSADPVTLAMLNSSSLNMAPAQPNADVKRTNAGATSVVTHPNTSYKGMLLGYSHISGTHKSDVLGELKLMYNSIQSTYAPEMMIFNESVSGVDGDAYYSVVYRGLQDDVNYETDFKVMRILNANHDGDSTSYEVDVYVWSK